MHVGALRDPLGRDPEALLEAWPSLPLVAEAVADAGVKVTVVQAAPWDRRFAHGGVEYAFVAVRHAGTLERRLGHWATPGAAAVGERVERIRPDVIHLHGLGFPLHLRRLRRVLPRTPILVQDHADRVPPRTLRPLFRQGLGHVDAVTFTAMDQAVPFRDAGLIGPHTRLFAVPESSSRFRPGSPDHARIQTGIHGDPSLLWLGHLDSNKDPLTILDAVALAAPEFPDLQLWCAYQGSPLLDEVRRRIRTDSVLSGRVHLLGPQPHSRVELLLRGADFLVQGSHREGSGFAVIEALATGTVPIVSDIPPFRALTGGGAVGFLARPGDAREFARAIRTAAACDRRVLRSRVRSHFERHLSLRAVGQRLVEVYREIDPCA